VGFFMALHQQSLAK